MPDRQLPLPIAAVRYFHRIGGLYYEMGEAEYDAQVEAEEREGIAGDVDRCLDMLRRRRTERKEVSAE